MFEQSGTDQMVIKSQIRDTNTQRNLRGQIGSSID